MTTPLNIQGWGLDDKGLQPYGDAAVGTGAALASAVAVSTREVAVTVTDSVQDNSPFLVGDALNPATWTVQRRDTLNFIHVVNVAQSAPNTYVLALYEEMGPASVTHRVGASALKDVAGNPITAPRNVDFLGLLDASRTSVQTQLASHNSSVRDIANPQAQSSEWFGGTLQLTAAGDYKLESGAAMVRKLIFRRLMSAPGDFFHLPSYGIGLRVKEPIPAANLGNLKTKIEQQVMREPELESVRVSLSLDSSGVLTVGVNGRLRTTGEPLGMSFKANDQGVVL
jgi:hypothetical protein